jgi:hypothetical protein
MSSDGFLRAMCYLGRLRFPEQLEPALAMLAENEREEALAILGEIKDLSQAEVLRRWSDLRAEEYVAMARSIRRRTGICIDELPPAVREHWVSWIRRQHE